MNCVLLLKKAASFLKKNRTSWEKGVFHPPCLDQKINTPSGSFEVTFYEISKMVLTLKKRRLVPVVQDFPAGQDTFSLLERKEKILIAGERFDRGGMNGCRACL
ncbi:MAG: hypothetical protein HY885_06050 [Deltaproteobacteria bacterium]|nr:hypothetical protein [Deltaproteobacteria bacterium]